MKALPVLLFLVFSCSSLLAQSISYYFTAPNAAHHEAEISVTADKLPVGPAYFRMSRSSPGRYAKHEFGKNVYNVKAYDAQGKLLQVEKADADIYTIPQHKGTVKVTYTLYANHADGTYASIDRTGYHLNMPAAFMWVKGMEKAPITITFAVTDTTWKVATQLKQGENTYTFTAPGLQYFMDSPVKVGNLLFSNWEVTNPDNKQYNMRLALQAAATPEEANRFTVKVARMVNEAKAVFNELPAFDNGSYTFIASINPYVKGDGMEHRNSTMITLPGYFDGSNDLLGVFSHEFFHCWNVERIRPADLEPFDFEKSNMSNTLWVSEGFTQYYGDLLLVRSGLMSEAAFLREMAGLANIKENTPGGKNYSPIENSQRAVFEDAGVAIDKTNYPNMYASYYTHGGAIALALDLDLRSNFKNITLDTYMQTLWKMFGKPEKPYTIIDLQNALASITNTTYAKDFFTKYVYGHEAYDYTSALQNAGVLLKRAAPGIAWSGNISFAEDNIHLTVAANTVKGSPIYEAGVDIADVLVSIDGKNITTTKAFYDVVAARKPGDKVPVIYRHNGMTIQNEMVLAEDPWFTIENIPGAATVQQREFKKAWLGTKVVE